MARGFAGGARRHLNIHKHKWSVISDDAVGYFEKQSGQSGSVIKTPGVVFQCSVCQKMILEPFDLTLKTVEIEP